MSEKRAGLISRQKDILRLLESNLRYMESLKIDPSLISDYKKLISYLKSRSLVEVHHILGDHEYNHERKTSNTPDTSQLENMSTKEVLEKINSPKTTRLAMEKIATARFGITKGGLSSFRSRDALKEKLESMLANEMAHKAISSVVIDGQNKIRKNETTD